MRQAIFLISTADRKGILAETTTFFYQRSLNILECRQYTDVRENAYYMRIAVELPPDVTRNDLESQFTTLAEKLSLKWSVYYNGDQQNVAVLVSKTSHCFYDLLMRSEEGNLGGKVVVAVGNHPDLEEVADRFRVPYYCLPTPRSGDPDQENALLELLKRHHIDLVVLARYMRVLSERVINAYPGRIINIHHAFLPAFQGGNPYLQAWERGVKMIGATAHYATVDLDEGPIIEQAVERITHESTPEDLRDLGRDIERRVLTRAVQFHLEHRVIVSGRRTVVFAK
ncbi:MAG: formyltetrahydrofolate deformylase [Lentisphaerae bacterium]|nr:formyltetrahydrofolate deformylase [Lentisphaerota bacterium]MBR2873038.1 formyltetrahydrofolate deformylase [Lentisphaeria bacterium]